MSSDLRNKLVSLVAKCDALRNERYGTPRWDPEAMQLLWYCAEAMREALLEELLQARRALARKGTEGG